MVLLKFSTLSREEMLRHVEFDGEERVRAAHAHGRGVLLFTGHFGFWEINALVHALGFSRCRCWRVRWTIRCCTICSNGAHVDRQRRHLPARCDSSRASRARFQPGGRIVDRPAHAECGCGVRRLLQPAASTTSALAALALKTGAPVIPVFALPLPGGRFRMVYEHPVDPPAAEHPMRFGNSPSDAPTCSKCTCGDTPTCGCGCTGDGVTFPVESTSGACSRRRPATRLGAGDRRLPHSPSTRHPDAELAR